MKYFVLGWICGVVSFPLVVIGLAAAIALIAIICDMVSKKQENPGIGNF